MEISCLFLLCALAVVALAQARPVVNSRDFATAYCAIADQNSFALMVPTTAPDPMLIGAPKENLLRTGFASRSTNRVCAMLLVVEPGKSQLYLAIYDWEQYERLESPAINFQKRTVQAQLKEPVMRAHGSGTETSCSFITHCANTPTTHWICDFCVTSFPFL